MSPYVFCLQIREECLATRNSAALFNMSYFGKFFLRGPDADAAVEWIFTNNIANCQVGKTVYTCMLNKNAGIEADLTVSVLEGQDGVSGFFTIMISLVSCYR